MTKKKTKSISRRGYSESELLQAATYAATDLDAGLLTDMLNMQRDHEDMPRVELVDVVDYISSTLETMVTAIRKNPSEVCLPYYHSSLGIRIEFEEQDYGDSIMPQFNILIEL